MASKPRARRARPAPATTASPLDMALQAEAAGRTPEGPAARLIENQNRLISADLRHRGWQIASERAGFGLKLLTGLVGVAAFVTVAVVLWSATQYRGLTVQPFSVPPQLQARGMTGEVAAQRMLDRLAELQRSTDSARPANSFANSWGDEITVAIPQTGVSVGELWRFLRAWLGEEVLITGEVVQTDGGLQVVVRAGGQAAPAVVAENGDVEEALGRAADALFAQTQPYRHAVSLWAGSDAEFEQAATALEALVQSGDALDRRWAFSGLVGSLVALGRFEEAVEIGRQGIVYAPDFAHLRGNLSGAYEMLGREESALAELVEGERIGSRPGEYSPQYADLASQIRGRALIKRRDLLGAAGVLSSSADDGSTVTQSLLIEAHLAMRDIGAARQIYPLVPLDEEVLPGASMWDHLAVWTGSYLEDWTPVLTVCRSVESRRQDLTLEAARSYLIFLGPHCVDAFLALGFVAEAEALLAEVSIRSPTLLAAQGKVAAAQGDHIRAERLFTEASRVAPSLPSADLAWGRARLARGDAEGAIERFREAARRSPRWADPLKFYADALVTQGNHRAAVRLYRQAARYAPRWGGLHLAWGRALEAAGDRRGAQVRYRQASDMDLATADRAEAGKRTLG